MCAPQTHNLLASFLVSHISTWHLEPNKKGTQICAFHVDALLIGVHFF